MVVGIERATGFEDAVGEVEELAHDGADDDHLRFASGREVPGEVGQDRVPAHDDDGGEVETRAQTRIALFREVGRTMY